MRRDFLPSFLVSIPLAFALPYACSSTGDSKPPPADEVKGYEDVIYEGEVTDEALVALVSALEQGAPKDDPAHSPMLTAPMGNVPKTPIPTFSWSLGKTASRQGPPVLLPTEHVPDARGITRTAFWLELVGPERTAEAHGTPFTGQGTWLVFSSSANPKLVRVLTSNTSYTPAQAAWDKLVGAGTVTLTLVGATFEQNRVASGGGPFKGSATSFTVTN